jgi:hypothetical protein
LATPRGQRRQTQSAAIAAEIQTQMRLTWLAVFAWKEDYKAMKSRMDKYKINESNAWALIYNQCSPELKTNSKEHKAMTQQRTPTTLPSY